MSNNTGSDIFKDMFIYTYTNFGLN